ncbi:MAG TPA: energy-coupling factor transporter transmembrane component T [Bacteroidota bacterium]
MRLSIPDKLSFVLFAWTSAFLLHWQCNIVFILTLVALEFFVEPFEPVSPVSRTYFKRFLGYSAVFLVVLVVANGLLVRQGPVRMSILRFSVYDKGLEYGLTVSARLVLLSLSVLLFFVSTRFQDFAAYLHTLGMPNAIVSIILLSLFFLEQLPHRISQIYTAQEARGAPVRAGILARGRAFFLILSPLVFSSIVESVERGIALDLRGYHLHRFKNVSHEPRNRILAWSSFFLLLALTVVAYSLLAWLSK